MGGSNPYIEKTQYTPATKKFKVTFVREGKTVEVDPERVPYAREGLESCNEPTDAELDQLDDAPGLTVKSRLGCQCVPDGTRDLVVEIPEWNKNFAKEAEH